MNGQIFYNNIMFQSLVSVIMPSFKSEMFISESIESILSQSYQNWELIIVDDASPDQSNSIIEKFIKKDNRIKLIKLDQNRGPAVARNEAIKIARGRYIAFLDSDDIWSPEKLDKQLNFMKEKDLSFTYSAYNVINEGGEIVGDFIPEQKITYFDMLKTSSIGCLTAIYDTKKLGKMYMPNIFKKQDYGLWLEILKKIKITNGIVELLASYRLRYNSVSSNKIIGGFYQWKIYRDVENISFFKSIYYFLYYVKNGIRKYQ